jgi:tetratricopeptide (TPR) repeat protein
MKKPIVLFFLTFVVLFNVSKAQEAANDSIPPELQRNIFVYSLASKYNDQQMTKVALYNILAINPGNVAILDSLALMYFEYRQYASAVLVSQDILSMNPNNMLATEIAAKSFDNLGVKGRSLPYYEKMYLNNQDIVLLYQIAYMQYDLKRFAEAKVNIDAVLASPQADNKRLYFAKNDQQNQEIPLKAAVYRLQALMNIAQNKTTEARDSYNKALEIAPDFQLVKTELQALN